MELTHKREREEDEAPPHRERESQIVFTISTYGVLEGSSFVYTLSEEVQWAAGHM